MLLDRDGRTEELHRLGRLGGLLQRNQGLQVRVLVDLLLDRGEFDELLGELVGVERGERILVLQLRGQQLQKRIEIAGDLLRCVDVGGPGAGRTGRRRCRIASVVRALASVRLIVVVMIASSNDLPLHADVDAAAQAQASVDCVDCDRPVDWRRE